MINIDLTTKNTVYNTLGPQAQWIQHRFGRRDYPDIDLDFEVVEQVVDLSQPINFISIFGDPSCHPDVLKILNLLDVGKVIFNTHLNFKNDELISILNSKRAYVVVPVYGLDHLADKVLLHSNWGNIEDNIKKLTCTTCLEFYVFEHNHHQLPLVKNLCESYNIDLKIRDGIAIHPDGFSPIVDENGNWLYDCYACNEGTTLVKWPNLKKTVNGYNSLIQYVKPNKGKSILNKPTFYKIHEKVEIDNISVSVSGHVFPSFELHQIFSNSLCSDWNCSLSKITNNNKTPVSGEFKKLCSYLTTIEQLLPVNNLKDHSFANILTNFANSNI